MNANGSLPDYHYLRTDAFAKAAAACRHTSDGRTIGTGFAPATAPATAPADPRKRLSWDPNYPHLYAGLAKAKIDQLGEENVRLPDSSIGHEAWATAEPIIDVSDYPDSWREWVHARSEGSTAEQFTARRRLHIGRQAMRLNEPRFLQREREQAVADVAANDARRDAAIAWDAQRAA
jgi:hypothetical protein